jgi:RNA polymerase-binding transcription factor DksA
MRAGTPADATVCQQGQHIGPLADTERFEVYAIEHPEAEIDWSGYGTCERCGSSVHRSQLRAA